LAYECAMNSTLVMTVIGADRPGLVESVASLVAAQGGNWLESRMARLGGQFAGILRVEAPAEKAAALTAALKALQAKGLTVVVQSDVPAPPAAVERLLQLELVGHDRPGIVRQITHALAAQGVNVEALETECASAPMSGEVLFKARATLHLPAACKVEALRQELEKIAADLIVDLSIGEKAADERNSNYELRITKEARNPKSE
jgi:glycine cleavage system regulatory protein